MTADRTGGGEPSATLALLWNTPDTTVRRKGPVRSVTVPQIVDAALALADGDGLAALTMRAVAEKVGISTMSVYTYVPGKPELLDLMVDTLYARMKRHDWDREPWRERLIAIAETNRALLSEHPWMTEVAAISRPPLGPGLMAKYENELAAFDNTGLADLEVDAALTFLLGFVQSHCRTAHDARRATTDSAINDAEWWAANQPILEQALDPAAYPRAVRIGVAAGESQGAAWDDERSWSFGLACTLDGLAMLIGPVNCA
ncbi:TetR/AcrR family transcriptional regulator [Microbacterium sp. CIAB417]|uniref:TetR/AcrR family transcriptional regulator n=1 Tax=Microbacterium sp. CIAB417 TaxID=2860287 RepID=UPI001FABB1D2|nr:TetR/AcrR family transcriptional regulator [Microbacterium sp. CIAB417]